MPDREQDLLRRAGVAGKQLTQHENLVFATCGAQGHDGGLAHLFGLILSQEHEVSQRILPADSLERTHQFLPYARIRVGEMRAECRQRPSHLEPPEDVERISNRVPGPICKT